MQIIKTIVYFIFWIIDLIVPEELLLKILNRSKNKLFSRFLVHKLKLMLEKNQPDFWKTRSAIFYFIYVKNIKLGNNNQISNIINKLLYELKEFDKDTRYLDVGCGYPIYLRNQLLKEKIVNYYGYDINPHISKFFKLDNVYNSYPDQYDYDVVLILSGVVKYFSKKDLNFLFEILNKINPKKIFISHESDYKIIKNKFRNSSSIEITLL